MSWSIPHDVSQLAPLWCLCFSLLRYSSSSFFFVLPLLLPLHFFFSSFRFIPFFFLLLWIHGFGHVSFRETNSNFLKLFNLNLLDIGDRSLVGGTDLQLGTVEGDPGSSLTISGAKVTWDGVVASNSGSKNIRLILQDSSMVLSGEGANTPGWTWDLQSNSVFQWKPPAATRLSRTVIGHLRLQEDSEFQAVFLSDDQVGIDVMGSAEFQDSQLHLGGKTTFVLHESISADIVHFQSSEIRLKDSARFLLDNWRLDWSDSRLSADASCSGCRMEIGPLTVFQISEQGGRNSLDCDSDSNCDVRINGLLRLIGDSGKDSEEWSPDTPEEEMIQMRGVTVSGTGDLELWDKAFLVLEESRLGSTDALLSSFLIHADSQLVTHRSTAVVLNPETIKCSEDGVGVGTITVRNGATLAFLRPDADSDASVTCRVQLLDGLLDSVEAKQTFLERVDFLQFSELTPGDCVNEIRAGDPLQIHSLHAKPSPSDPCRNSVSGEVVIGEECSFLEDITFEQDTRLTLDPGVVCICSASCLFLRSFLNVKKDSEFRNTDGGYLSFLSSEMEGKSGKIVNAFGGELFLGGETGEEGAQQTFTAGGVLVLENFGILTIHGPSRWGQETKIANLGDWWMLLRKNADGEYPRQFSSFSGVVVLHPAGLLTIQTVFSEETEETEEWLAHALDGSPSSMYGGEWSLGGAIAANVLDPDFVTQKEEGALTGFILLPPQLEPEQLRMEWEWFCPPIPGAAMISTLPGSKAYQAEWIEEDSKPQEPLNPFRPVCGSLPEPLDTVYPPHPPIAAFLETEASILVTFPGPVARHLGKGRIYCERVLSAVSIRRLRSTLDCPSGTCQDLQQPECEWLSDEELSIRPPWMSRFGWFDGGEDLQSLDLLLPPETGIHHLFLGIRVVYPETSPSIHLSYSRAAKYSVCPEMDAGEVVLDFQTQGGGLGRGQSIRASSALYSPSTDTVRLETVLLREANGRLRIDLAASGLLEAWDREEEVLRILFRNLYGTQTEVVDILPEEVFTDDPFPTVLPILPDVLHPLEKLRLRLEILWPKCSQVDLAELAFSATW